MFVTLKYQMTGDSLPQGLQRQDAIISAVVLFNGGKEFREPLVQLGRRHLLRVVGRIVVDV